MLKEGDPAPGFQLPADDGHEICLQDLRGKHVALYFYPKASTPGCTTEALEFRELKNEFEKLNTTILGCSADSVESQAKFKAKQKLNFPLLSDPDFTVIEAYDARRMKSFLGKSYLGIVRSTVLIGPDGKVEKIWPTAKSKGHAAEVVEALKSLQ
ncbi:MAG TPA: thioredoxin-dependent thiol peroxidase [Candidatus Acidoferrales bacterium]|jgi:peroxiredoxin Q/BCP|nr:thioredoxin-dependent thiol peroxidase [Candidatus Acidoferrales bacterium]